MKELKMKRFIKQGVALLLCIGLLGGLFDGIPAIKKNFVMEAKAKVFSTK